jgi:cephalosporin hydroxylase
MKLIIDTTDGTLTQEADGERRILGLYTKEAFELIAEQWVKVGWNQKYSYTFSWMGRPIIQLPEDIVRTQEVVYRVRPDVIIETGIAHGGSLIYYASLCKAMGKGRVIGIDIEIRLHNRKAIQTHELFPLITLIEGSSTSPKIVRHVRSLVKPQETVLVILDSNHSRQYVLDELEAYYALVTKGSYIVATDGSMKHFAELPRGSREWSWDNPADAALEFSSAHPEFVIEQPPWLFNESNLTDNITHWSGAWLRRK